MTRGRLGLAAHMGALVAIAAVTPPTWACGYDAAMPDLAALHPGSIAVAVAVRAALDHQQLRAPPELPSAAGLDRASRWLRDIAPQVPALSGAPRGSVAVLLVESGLWARYRIGGAGVAAEVHVEGPREGEPVIVTSEAALSALLEHSLDARSAERLGVLVVTR